MLAILRLPIVGFAYVVRATRRIPGVAWIERHAAAIAAVLIFAAVVALIAWGAERSPQRVALADLVYGNLSPMQSWIIVAGELGSETASAGEFRYRLVDPTQANAELIVVSASQLPLGHITISGTFLGPYQPRPDEFRWVGQMRAEAELAREQDPPWIAIGLTGAAMVLAVAGRTSYPVFFSRGRPTAASEMTKLPVGLRSADGDIERATLVARSHEAVELNRPGSATLALRLHSPHTAVEIGELRWLNKAEPALVIHMPSEQLTLVFATNGDRDAAYAALTEGVFA